MNKTDDTEPIDPLKMTEEDKRRIREIQSNALREVGPGLESVVRVRLPGSSKTLSMTDEDDRFDARARSRLITWALFVLLVLLVGLAVWAVFWR